MTLERNDFSGPVRLSGNNFFICRTIKKVGYNKIVKRLRLNNFPHKQFFGSTFGFWDIRHFLSICFCVYHCQLKNYSVPVTHQIVASLLTQSAVPYCSHTSQSFRADQLPADFPIRFLDICLNCSFRGVITTLLRPHRSSGSNEFN